MLTDEEIIAVCRIETDQAMGFDADTLASIREAALNYYNGDMVAAGAGRSQFVSHDVADTVHSLLSQTANQFKASSIVFMPQGEQDESQAQMESDMVRWMLEKEDGWRTLNSPLHDALLSGNGWIKCHVEEDVDVATETYPTLDALQLASVSAPTAESQEVTVRETKTGHTVRRETTTRNLKVEAVPADVMLYSTEVGEGDINKLRMVGERIMFTDSALKQMGVSEDDIGSIPDIDSDYWPSVRAREGDYRDRTDERSTQQAERQRECFDTYIRLDMEENGTSELWHVLWGGNTIIEKEPAKCIPYATGSPVPMPHRVAGQGMYQLQCQVQDAKTHTMRNFLDNLAVANNSRVGAVEGQVNLKDLTQSRINGVVRIKAPDAIVPLPASDIGQQSMAGMQLLDNIRSNRGGAAVEMNESDRQLMSSSATAASGMIASSERMAGWYCDNLVGTLLADTYKLIHKQMRYNMPGEVPAKLRGKWVTTNPEQWQERTHLEVVSAPTTTENNRKKAALELLFQQQMQLLQMGGENIITDKAKTYGTMSDWIRLTQIGQPEEYLIDPTSPESIQAQQQLSQQQQQQAQAQKAQMDQMLQIEQAKVAQDRYKVDKEVAWKYYDTDADSEVQEAKITTDAITKLETVRNVGRETGTGTD